MNYCPANIAKSDMLQHNTSLSKSITKIQKGECRDKTGKQRFTGIIYAEPHHILCKDNER